jgi:two-component system, response regulator, stage 0 sporulation protein F
MSPPHHETGAPVCWNCEGPVGQARDVVVRAPSGGKAVLTLCRSCHESVYLPLVPEARELSLAHRRAGNILVVEDDPGVRALLELALVTEGFKVDTATNGVEALKKAREQIPDAIVLDLRMPVMSGQEFLREWRQATPPPAVPVVAISAHHRTATAQELGVHAYLRKPFDLRTLVGTVDALLGLAAVDSVGRLL